jgi:uncharacterized SAM-binding protein YcdF (DUF218 family)
MNYNGLLTSFLFLLSGLGLFGLRHYRGTTAWKTTAAGIGGLLILCWPPAIALAAWPLVGRYLKQSRPNGNAEVIVVLSGAVNEPTRRRPYVLLGQDTYKRVLHAAWLFHNWEALPILVSGGPGGFQAEPASLAMRRMLEEQGVPSSMIWEEGRSRSTHENALFSGKILRDRGIREIALVVDADSMLRAEKCFRKLGFAVEPLPCWIQEFDFSAGNLLPSWQALSRSEILLYETMGLFWYWAHGWA